MLLASGKLLACRRRSTYYSEELQKQRTVINFPHQCVVFIPLSQLPIFACLVSNYSEKLYMLSRQYILDYLVPQAIIFRPTVVVGSRRPPAYRLEVTAIEINFSKLFQVALHTIFNACRAMLTNCLAPQYVRVNGIAGVGKYHDIFENYHIHIGNISRIYIGDIYQANPAHS